MVSTAKAWERELGVLHERLGDLFKRPEPRQRSLAYLKGLLGAVERKNGWQLAEWIGEATPDGVQHLAMTSPSEIAQIGFPSPTGLHWAPAGAIVEALTSGFTAAIDTRIDKAAKQDALLERRSKIERALDYGSENGLFVA